MALDIALLHKLQTAEEGLSLEFYQRAPVQLIAEKGHVPACFLQADPVVFHASEVEVPVIDLSRYHSGDEEAKQEVRAHIASACEEWGFFQVVNHGADAWVLEQGLDAVRQFYAQPVEEKLKCAVKPGRNFAGYGRLQQLRDSELEWRDYFFHHQAIFHGPEEGHEWPQQPPDYRQRIVKWQTEVAKVGSLLFAIMSQNLGLPPSYLNEVCDTGTVSSNYYPPCARPSDVLGLNAHADASGVNILQQTSGVPGLQILRNGEWLTIHPVPGALVVNVGDVLQIISNGRYQSLLHRGVVSSSVEDRISLLLGLRPQMDTVLVPQPQRGEPLQYRSVTYQEYLNLRGYITGRLGGKGHLESIRTY